MDEYLIRKLHDVFQTQIGLISYETGRYLYVSDGFTLSMEREEDLIREIKRVLGRTGGKPAVFMETDQVYCGIFEDKSGDVLIIGPMARVTLSESEMKEYRYLHRKRGNWSIPKVSFAVAVRELSLAYYLMTERKVEPDEVLFSYKGQTVSEPDVEGAMELYQVEKAENKFSYRRSDYEAKLLQLVKAGDVDAVRQEMSLTADLNHDELSNRYTNRKKRFEYYVVTYLSLLARAAVEGGANPTQAIERCDYYLSRVEDCKGFADLALLGNRATMDFAEQVQKSRKDKTRSPYVEACKDYVMRNLRRPIRVGEIAPCIGVNRSYLAKRFMEVEGTTIQAYIMRERCVHAANLLRYSDYSLAQISAYFCFSSQSHFGKQFKHYLAMTPKEYRLKYHVTKGSWGEDQ